MNICPPAIVYFILVSTQIIIDVFKGYYFYALLKFIIMLIITFLIDFLCKKELTPIAWFLVLIPYIYMIYLTFLLIYLFGVDVIKGNSSTTTTNNTNNSSIKTPNSTIKNNYTIDIDSSYEYVS